MSGRLRNATELVEKRQDVGRQLGYAGTGSGKAGDVGKQLYGSSTTGGSRKCVGEQLYPGGGTAAMAPKGTGKKPLAYPKTEHLHSRKTPKR